MRFKILEALIEKDVLALGEDLFGYDTTLTNVVKLLKFANEAEPAISVEELIEAVYDEIAKGVLGDVNGEG